MCYLRNFVVGPKSWKLSHFGRSKKKTRILFKIIIAQVAVHYFLLVSIKIEEYQDQDHANMGFSDQDHGIMEKLRSWS